MLEGRTRYLLCAYEAAEGNSRKQSLVLSAMDEVAFADALSACLCHSRAVKFLWCGFRQPHSRRHLNAVSRICGCP